ncbi:MAG: MBL fold metallo-hydrolase [bacterium]
METPVSTSPTFEAAGVRGSRVTTDVHFGSYGGDTTCLLLTSSSGEHLLVDGGSGLFRFNPIINSNTEINVFVSHPHFDHIQGFFFLDTFYRAGKKVLVHCSTATQRALVHLFAPPYFPVSLAELPSPPTWYIFPDDAGSIVFTTPSFKCEAFPIPHPGGAYALLATDVRTGQTILILNDIEIHPDEPFEKQVGLEPLLHCVSTCGSIDTLIIDAMYEPADMPSHKGWGHTDFMTAIAFGKHLRAQNICLAHHNPTATDDVLANRQRTLSEHNVSFLRQHHVHPWKV